MLKTLTKSVGTERHRQAERAPELAPDHTAEADGRWLVLIGGSDESSDPDEVEQFLSALWPDFE